MCYLETNLPLVIHIIIVKTVFGQNLLHNCFQTHHYDRLSSVFHGLEFVLFFTTRSFAKSLKLPDIIQKKKKKNPPISNHLFLREKQKQTKLLPVFLLLTCWNGCHFTFPALSHSHSATFCKFLSERTGFNWRHSCDNDQNVCLNRWPLLAESLRGVNQNAQKVIKNAF